MHKAIIKKSMSPIYKNNIKKIKELSDEGIYGTCVDILKKEENFYKIRTFYGYEGYISKNNLEIKEDKLELWNKRKKVMINNNYVNINAKPDIKSRIISNFVRGEVVGIEENYSYKKWAKIYLVNGYSGYIRKEFIKKVDIDNKVLDENILRENIVNTSLLYLNSQYKWGGKSCLGIDCSGLCFMTYFLNSIIINRDSYLKEKFPMKEIKIKSIKKGDLIFFPGHVAIYIGRKKYIHSSSLNGLVTINSLDKKSNIYNDKLFKSITKVASIFSSKENNYFDNFKI